jgi:predicted dehydrogenase
VGTPTQKPSRRDFLAHAAAASALAGCATTATTGATAAPVNATRRTLGPNDKVRCAIIGAGGRGSSLLRETLQRDDVEVVAVCDAYDLWRDRATSWCKEHYDAVTGYTLYAELLAAENLDAVIIATPDHIHADAILAALNYKLDVYVEKPMTLTTEMAEAVRGQVREHGAVLQVGTQLRSTDIYQRGRDLYQSGTIGTLAEVQVNRHAGDGLADFNAPPAEANAKNVNWDAFLHGTKHYRFDVRRYFQWRLFEEYSNGVTGDLMLHHLDACHFITGVGMPERAVSIGGIYHYDDGRTVSDTVSTILGYEEGFQFNYTTTLVNGHYGIVERYLGSDGVLEFTGMGTLKVIKRDFENVIESDGLDTRAHLANFFECVRTRETPIAPIDAAFQGAASCHMAVLSERSGEAVHWNRSRDTIKTGRARNV